MKIDIHAFPYKETTPVYLGYIEKEIFDAEECFNICHWNEWTDEMPKELHPVEIDSDKVLFGHGICFTNPETQEKWLALTVGWLVGDSLKISDYVERHKNDIIWQKEYVLVSQGIEIYRTTNKEEAEKMMNESNKSWREYVERCIEEGERPADNEVFMYEEGEE